MAPKRKLRSSNEEKEGGGSGSAGSATGLTQGTSGVRRASKKNKAKKCRQLLSASSLFHLAMEFIRRFNDPPGHSTVSTPNTKGELSVGPLVA